jgi:hypothetical protein
MVQNALFFSWFDDVQFGNKRNLGPIDRFFIINYEAFVENFILPVSRHNHFNALIEKIALQRLTMKHVSTRHANRTVIMLSNITVPILLLKTSATTI